jgi:TRAP-type C4-dicarboxylate transport system permease small subunit
MRWRTFLIYNAAGGIVWAVIFGTLGYLAGGLFHNDFGEVERLARTVSWVGAAVIVAAALLIFFFVRIRLKRSSAKALQTTPTTHAELTSEVADANAEPMYTDASL